MQNRTKHIGFTKHMERLCMSVVLLLLLAACDRIIELEDIKIEPQLVICGIVTPGDTASLLIQCNYITTELNPETRVSGAEALVYHQEQVHGRYTESSRDTGRYVYSGLPFEEGETYRLEVRAKGFPTATSQTAVPKTPVFALGTHFWYPRDKNYFFPDLMGIDLTIDDPIGQENHYRVSAISGFLGQTSDFDVESNSWRDTIRYIHHQAELTSNSPVIETIFRHYYRLAQVDINSEASIYRLFYPEVLFFSDRYFNGQKFVLPLEIGIYNARKSMVLRLRLTAISPEYSQLVRSAAAYEKTDRAMFSEPLQLYSNIENGLGYWVAENPITISYYYRIEDKKF